MAEWMNDGVVGATTVELTEDAVYAKALGDVEVQIREVMRALKLTPMPKEVTGMTKTVAALYQTMAATDDTRQRRRPPSSAAIDLIVPIVECLLKLDKADRNILMVRGVGLKWDAVVEELDLDCSRWTVKRMHDDALTKMLCVMLERDAKIACSRSPK